MEVQEVMSAEVVTVLERETVNVAASRMMEYNVGCVVVVRGDKPVGILTETDILKRIVVNRKDASKMEVRDIMTSPPITIPSLASLESAADLMNQRNVKRLVVVSENTGTLSGVVTAKDLVVAETKLIRVLTNYIRFIKKEGGKDSKRSS